MRRDGNRRKRSRQAAQREDEIATPGRGLVSRRAVFRGAAAIAFLAGIDTPPIAWAHAGTIRIGHLAPRTGPFGPLGDHAVMGVQLAAEEINAVGGIKGRRIELLLEDSADPQIGSAKAARMITRDKVALLIGDVEPRPWLARVSIVPMPVAFVARFIRRYGKPPQAPAWIDYLALKRAAQSSRCQVFPV